MKKIITILALSLFLASVSFADNSGTASTGEVQLLSTSTGTETSTGNTVLEVTSAISDGKNVLKANPLEKIIVTYYYGAECPHCKVVSNYLEKVDGYNKMKIDKREVWHNKDNQKKMMEDLTRLGLANSSSIGVPFLVVNNDWKETYLTGETDVLNFFESYLGKVETVKASDKGENNTRVIVFLLIVWALAALIPFFLTRKK